LYYVC